MIALLFSFIIILYAFYRLLRKKDNPQLSFQYEQSPKKSIVLQQLVSEAFQFTTSPDSQQSQSHVYPILIMYATEYGFAREVACTVGNQFKSLTNLVDKHGNSIILSPRIINVLHYSVIDFTREPIVAFICSTTGDGVPPNEAAAFRDALVSKDLQLPHTSNIAVLALGDRAYPHFCRAGAIFDNLFGDACRFLPRMDVDQESWDVIDDWIQQVQSAIQTKLKKLNLDHLPVNDYLTNAIEKYSETFGNNNDHIQYTLNNPYKAIVKSKRLLTKTSSSLTNGKEVIRVEFDITRSDIQYQVGDALAVIPRNNSDHVMQVLLSTASNGDEMVKLSENGQLIEFNQALTNNLDLKTIKPELILHLAKHCGQASEIELANKILGFNTKTDEDTRKGTITLTAFGKQYISEREVYDVLGDFSSASLHPNELMIHLRPLHARYYSISSSPEISPDTIAITVDVLRYSSLNTQREGVASTFLNDRCARGDCEVDVFLSRNPNFSLPKEESRAIVMIGPGTGIAPFIGFIEERIAKNAKGENWLFFGCRYEKQDFLYKEELMQWQQDGCLRLDAAFSRDGPEKVYVQHKMEIHKERLWKMIDEEDAHVYVCGDGRNMARDVDEALKDIVRTVGGKPEEAIDKYIEELAEMKRYQRDVWVS